MILTLPRARNSFLELVGSSRVYVSRAILIKCEPTSSNTTLLQVSVSRPYLKEIALGPR